MIRAKVRMKHPWMLRVYFLYLGFLVEINWIDHEHGLALGRSAIKKNMRVTLTSRGV